MPIVTEFDTKARYIFLPIYMTTKMGKRRKFDAILDCGAPFTEFSDKALISAGYFESLQQGVQIKPGLSTQKYAKVVIPRVEICTHNLDNLTVYISRFEKFWGIDALIGLDFFRRFKVTVDYGLGQLVTAPI